MANLTVNTADNKVANDGKLSLREAVAQANATAAVDTIRFAAGLLLVFPGVLNDLAGAALAAIVIVVQVMQRRAARAQNSTPA